MLFYQSSQVIHSRFRNTALEYYSRIWVSNFVQQKATHLFWGGLVSARGKLTVSGVPNCLHNFESCIVGVYIQFINVSTAGII